MNINQFSLKILACFSLFICPFNAFAGQGWHIFVKNYSTAPAAFSATGGACWYDNDLAIAIVQPGASVTLYTEERDSRSCNLLFSRVKNEGFRVSVAFDANNIINTDYWLSTNNKNCPYTYKTTVYVLNRNNSPDICFTPNENVSRKQYEFYMIINPDGTANTYVLINTGFDPVYYLDKF